jgi:glycosyltransferase involved in cell wall biosynthesis
MLKMIAESLRPPPVSILNKPKANPGETIYCNALWRRIDPVMSVLVPVYKHDPSALMRSMRQCRHAENVELILYDDGSADPDLTKILQAELEDFTGAGCLITAQDNMGRAKGRNRLEELARSEWLLFLDADMIPDHKGFLVRYMKLIQQYGHPMLIVGGFSLKQVEPNSKTQLHFAQCARSECVPADERRTNPGRFVFTSNVLVHKDIMTVVPFDDDFIGWGWEDVDWGTRAARRFPVLHIDNTATHVGLDTPDDLMRKYGRSGENFWLAAERHPETLKSTPLYRMARVLSWIPGQVLLKWMSAGVARLPGWMMPIQLRLVALKLFRASAYAEARNARNKTV